MPALRIHAPKPAGDYTLTRGTRVTVGGVELPVSRLDLVAEVGSLWRCTLETTAVAFDDGPHDAGPFSLQALTWTPHEMARFQDRVRGVDRRFADWRNRDPANAKRCAEYVDARAAAIVRALSQKWMQN